ncbi:hypothetical protein CcaverHIS002_0501430 [Cutaneotrichosporon cavernicola]|nr:hypothetical protein CcaverHIS002_0501430 [Cutaneotrichosporon cavernicola]
MYSDRAKALRIAPLKYSLVFLLNIGEVFKMVNDRIKHCQDCVIKYRDMLSDTRIRIQELQLSLEEIKFLTALDEQRFNLLNVRIHVAIIRHRTLQPPLEPNFVVISNMTNPDGLPSLHIHLPLLNLSMTEAECEHMWTYFEGMQASLARLKVRECTNIASLRDKALRAQACLTYMTPILKGVVDLRKAILRCIMVAQWRMEMA